MNYGKKGVEEQEKNLTSKGVMIKKRVSVSFFKVFLLTLIAITVVIICTGMGILNGVISSAPDISKLNVQPTKYSTRVLDQDGNELTKLVSSGSNRISVNIDQIPEYLQNAFIAIEDERFMEHNGIDVKGIIRAGFIGLTTGSFSEGASTITQQLLKNNVFTDWTEESSFTEKMKRKIQEQYLAIQLEKTMSKDLILQNYLNTINLGQNSLGVQSASHRYFNKDVSELSLSESAVIAAITQNPSRYNPVTSPGENKKRQEKVLKNMVDQNMISKKQYEEALADDVYKRIQDVNAETETSSIYSYFVDELTQQVMDALQETKGYTQTQAYNLLYSGGLTIYTTQNMALQKICDEEFSNPENFPEMTEYALTYRLSVEKADGTIENYNELMMEKYFKEIDGLDYDLIFSTQEEAKEQVERYKEAILSPSDKILENGERLTLSPQPQASLVLMEQSTGYVKAIVGGRGNKEASLTLNRATNTVRQPGSTFKVLAAFAPALDTAGMTLASVQDDAPYSYENGRPVSNWYKTGYKGLTSMRLAIQNSMNIVAVKTLTDITPQLGYNYLINFGFHSLVKNRINEDGTVNSDINQSLALGGLTDGVSNMELTAAYAAIANKGTYIKPIYFTKITDHDGNVIIDNTPETTTVLKESTAFLLTDAMKDVMTSGTGIAAKLDRMPTAGKTGTTSKTYDIWFCGYTPYYTCSIWSGYDTNKSMGDASYHKLLWKKIMDRVHEDLEVKEFPVPDDIVNLKVCKKSGKLAVAGLCDQDERGSMVTTEYFAKDTIPTEQCDAHVSVTLCASSSLPVNTFCPEELRVNKVRLLRPEGAQGDTEDSPYCVPGGVCPYHGGYSTTDMQPEELPEETPPEELGPDITVTPPAEETPPVEVFPPTTEPETPVEPETPSPPPADQPPTEAGASQDALSP